MPRPKVDPRFRKRSVRACVPCKLSKVRCDSQEPCSRCVGKGREDFCQYEASVQQPRPRPRPRQTQLQPPLQPQLARGQPRRLSDQSPKSAGDASTASQTPSQANQSRMLLNSKGEKVYIGHTASLSYLNFVRHVVRTSMGPSPFTENESMNFMLEVDIATNGVSLALQDISRDQSNSLIESFIEASSGILDVFTGEEFTALINSSGSSAQNDATSLSHRKGRSLNAAFKLALAIGLQTTGADILGPEAASALFAQGQRFAFEGMLCDVSLDVVRIFLLMAFYMLGACQRNAAFMYLGIASKAASALGLGGNHAEGRMLGGQEYDIRQRIWQSLCVLDTLVSAILGRRGTCSLDWPDDRSVDGEMESQNSASIPAVYSTYSMCALIESLEQDLRKGANVTSSSAETFLYELRLCSQRLPPDMRSFTVDASKTQLHGNRKKYLAALHVACTYYFAVILATRPFLTSHLMLKLKDQGFGLLEDEKPSFNAERRLKITNLAQVCVDAAKFMANMLSEAAEAGLVLSNMCMVKAWAFGAGLLLGFSLFVEENASAELEQAFAHAMAIELHLSTLSPQAKHYHEILSHLGTAIETHRQRRADDKRKTTSRFLYPLFSNGPGGSNDVDRQIYPSPFSTEQFDAELGSNLDLDDGLSAGLDVDLSEAFSMSKEMGDEYWQPFCWGMDNT